MTNEERVRDWFVGEVAALMEDNGLRPYHIAYLCQFKNNQVYHYLNGRILPNPWQLVLMAEVFDCTVDGLLGYEMIEMPYDFEQYTASKTYSNAKEYAHCFADRFGRYLRMRKIDVETLSQTSGISANTINRWISSCPQLPRTTQLLAICEALGCTPSELLGY